ncbi:MAG: flavodoxin family protein [Candidatus Methanomethylophilaceae archaeon]
MRITLINGQDHRGNTWYVAHRLIDSISFEKTVEEFFLPRDLDHMCRGCYSCLEGRERCPFREDVGRIEKSMLGSDLIILATPNYCMMPSAPMKAFLDLSFTNWMSHRPHEAMFSKRAVVISTAAGAGAGKAAKLVATNLRNWGIPYVRTFGIAVNATDWDTAPEKKRKRMEKAMSSLGRTLSKGGKVRVGIRTRMMFAVFRGMQKAGWGASDSEREYWENMGWLDGSRPWKK